MAINMAKYMANRRDTRRNELVNLAGGRCVECGSLDRLEFNHRNRNEKSFSLSGAGLDKSWAAILVELDKCDLLCYTCHKRYTAGQWASGEITPWNKGRDQKTREKLSLRHGTAKMYQDGKCRCVDCKRAKSKYRNGELRFNEVG